MHLPVNFLSISGQDPDGEIENSGKSIFEIRIPNFCYIQVMVFDPSYLPVAAVGTHHEKVVKKFECNRSSGFGFQKCFSRNFQFHRRNPSTCYMYVDSK